MRIQFVFVRRSLRRDAWRRGKLLKIGKAVVMGHCLLWCVAVLAVNLAIEPVPELESDPYNWYGRHEKIVKTAKNYQPEFVLIGDSITHYWCGWPKDKTKKNPGPIGATESGVNEHFRATFGAHAVNMGFGYDRIQNMLWRVKNGELDGLKPKYVIVMAGTNNQTTSPNFPVASTAEEMTEGLKSLVALIRKKTPKAKIVVMGILPRTRVPDSDRKSQTVNAALKAHYAGKKGILFLDMWDDFKDRRFGQKDSLYSDGVHLNRAGYEVWAKRLKAAGIPVNVP